MKGGFADRLKKLPPYLFVEIDKAKKQAIANGKDVIDLGIGDPDTPTPRFIIDAMNKALEEPRTHRYALDQGCAELRQEIANWYKTRFNVALDPGTEILPLIGSKEGIAHIPLAFVNPGETVLVPDPCYPPYKSGTIFAGGVPYIMPLKWEKDFLPDLKGLKPHVTKSAKMMFLNYPNNPTSAVASKEFYAEVVKLATREDIIVCHDAAYSEISFDGYRAPSFLELSGAKEIGLEFHSLSKTFNMTGWRVGFVCGNEMLIKGLAKLKSNIDSGIFTAIQLAGVAALKNAEGTVSKLKDLYEGRRDALLEGLEEIGINIKRPKATFYVWIPVPKNYTSITFARLLLEQASCIVTPGNGFGPNGEGYVRIALTVDKERIKEAMDRIKKVV